MKSVKCLAVAFLMLFCTACDNDDSGITPLTSGPSDANSYIQDDDFNTEHVQLRLMAKMSPEVRTVVIWVTGDAMTPICRQFAGDEEKALEVTAGKRLFQCSALDSNQRVIYTAEKEQTIEMNTVNYVDILNEDLLKPFTVRSQTDVSGKAVLEWDSAFKSASYIVSWNEAGKEPVSENPISVSEITKTGLTNGKDYYFTVGVKGNDACPMLLSEETVVKIPPLDIPYNLKAAGSDQKISLSWASAYADASYIIYWNTSGNVSESDAVMTGITQKMHDHEGLDNGTSYCYRISQVVSGVRSGLSEEICAAPVAPPPAPPPAQFSIIVSDCGFILDDQFEIMFNNVSCENDFGMTKECFFNLTPPGVHNLDVVFKKRAITDPTDPGTLCLEIKSDSASFVAGGPGQTDDKNVKYNFPPDLGKTQTWLIDVK